MCFSGALRTATPASTSLSPQLPVIAPGPLLSRFRFADIMRMLNKGVAPPAIEVAQIMETVTATTRVRGGYRGRGGLCADLG